MKRNTGGAYGARKALNITTLAFALLTAVTVCVMAQAPAQSPAPPTGTRKHAAILVFDGVQIIDFTGPWEILDSQFDVFTVSEKAAPITTSGGMSLNPAYTIENAPKAEILVVPGGGSSHIGNPGVGLQMANPKVIRWVQAEAKDADYVMSVCNGAFILAQAGLLDGQSATTTAGYIELLKQTAPRTKVVADQRLVDNGKIITTAGLSSGIDGALHIIDRVFGRGQSQFVAVNTEYNWDPSGQFVRAQFGDMPMLNTFVMLKFRLHAQPLRYEASRQSWHSEWALETKQPLAELLAAVNGTVANADHWSRIDSAASEGSESHWTISSETWGDWKALITAETVPGGHDQVRVTINVDRREAGGSR